MNTAWVSLHQRLTACRACPRLAKYLDGMKRIHPDWWCRPVPGFGDPRARLLVVGLAPAARGANRTGRMFTGDLPGGSGHWVYGLLHELGLANRPDALSREDGLRLKNVYITAAARCAPPQNKPTPKELETCSNYLAEELRLLTEVRVLLALGKIAHDRLLKHFGIRLSAAPFRHGAVHPLPGGLTLVDTYHPSRQNTLTKRLTYPMWRTVWTTALRIGRSGSPTGRGRRKPG